MKRFALILCLLMTGAASAATYYCDAAAGGAGAGTEGDPWDWDDATDSSNVVGGGHIINCTGAYGDIDFRHTNSIGTNGNNNVYQAWSGQTDPSCTSLVHSGVSNDPNVLYVTFDGWTIWPGSGTVVKPAILFFWVGGITYSNCDITGQYNSNISSGMSDFYPQVLGGDSSVSVSGGTDSPDVTFDTCVFNTSARPINAVRSSNWLITNCTFNRMAEDSVVLSAAYGGSTITGCTFSGQTQDIGQYHWPKSLSGGVATGTWAGHEYETCTQDNTGATSLFTAVSASAWACYANRSATLPDKSSTDVWRLDSDPNNIYYTPNGIGDAAHQDFIAIQSVPGAHTFNITKNRFTCGGPGGQGIIFQTNNVDTVANIINNICYIPDDYVNFGIWSGPGTINFHNNVVDSVGNLKGISIGSTVVVNITNNIIGAILLQNGVITSDYNIWPNSSVHANTIADEANSLYSQDFTTGFYTDYANQNYTPLNISSPQVDIGDSTYAPADDYIGTARPQNSIDDIGPYELLGAAPTTYLF